ncbi:hypothetical protein ACRAWD_18395 [Caulobacter segnis]
MRRLGRPFGPRAGPRLRGPARRCARLREGQRAPEPPRPGPGRGRDLVACSRRRPARSPYGLGTTGALARRRQNPVSTTAVGERLDLPAGRQFGGHAQHRLRRAGQSLGRLSRSDPAARPGLFPGRRGQDPPLIVTAGDKSVTAVGTAFDVRLEPGKLSVTLVEGRCGSPACHRAAPGRDVSRLALRGRSIAPLGDRTAVDTAGNPPGCRAAWCSTANRCPAWFAEMNRFSRASCP